jgi:hypothetical protein
MGNDEMPFNQDVPERSLHRVGTQVNGSALIVVLDSVIGAVVSISGTSCCNGIDIFCFLTACVDDNTTATGCVGYAVARCAEVENLQDMLV